RPPPPRPGRAELRGRSTELRQPPRIAPGPAVRCAGRAPTLRYERFPREESTIARSTTQPAPSHAAGQPLTLDGRYHIVERIAAGGMGEVFRAHDAVLAREVAVKVLHTFLAREQGLVEVFLR